MLLAHALTASVLAASSDTAAGDLLATPDGTRNGPVTLAKPAAATLGELVALTTVLLDVLALLPHGR